MIILTNHEGKKIKLSKTDPCLFHAARNPPNTGTNYTRGVDLYAHLTRTGNWYYYTYTWSMWQGEQEDYNLLTESKAKKFVIQHLNGNYNKPNLDLCKKIWGTDWLEEDA